MDYSNEFCEMCFQSAELQSLKDSIPTRKVMMEKLSENKFCSSISETVTDIYFWIPSETQLQRLVPEIPEAHYFNFLRESYHSANTEIPLNIFKSFEQYWLVFVMLQRFKKIWNESDWVKNTSLEDCSSS